jgi:hypothetical protein
VPLQMAKKLSEGQESEIAHRLAGRQVPSGAKYLRSRYLAEQAAWKLFAEISRALGPKEAKEVFELAAASKKEGSSWTLDRALVEDYKKTGSLQQTARNAMEASDGAWKGDYDRNALVQRVKRLTDKQGLVKRPRGRPSTKKPLKS